MSVHTVHDAKTNLSRLIAIDHARRAGSLPTPHKDPFDRMLVAQAQIEGLTLVSSEAMFDAFEVARLW